MGACRSFLFGQWFGRRTFIYLSHCIFCSVLVQLNVASHRTDIAHCASRYIGKGDSKCNDDFGFYFTEHEGEGVVARVLTTMPAGNTDNGSTAFGLFAFFRIAVRLCIEIHRVINWILFRKRQGNKVHVCFATFPWDTTEIADSSNLFEVNVTGLALFPRG